jgi:uncharacterized protein (TIGR00730 family)
MSNHERPPRAQTQKAYKNLRFLNSAASRHIRILAEYEEPRQRFIEEGVDHTIVFFGSARIKSPEESAERLAAARLAAENNPTETAFQEALAQAERVGRLSKYYSQAQELAERLTRWSMDRYEGRRYTICSGGGPGIMEAANRGAHDVPGGKSIGLGISLPFEEGVNGYVTPELAFEFHYFFTRKLWFLYLAKGLVVFPGGFGTLDELFEALTLVQTRKIKRRIPIILFGKEYWEPILNLKVMADFGTIAPADIDLMFRTDSVDEAFEHLKRELVAWEHSGVEETL